MILLLLIHVKTIYTYVAFILQCRVLTKFLTLYAKRQKTFNILLEFQLGVYSAFHDRPTLDIEHMVTEDFVRLVDVLCNGVYVHLYIFNTYTAV